MPNEPSPDRDVRKNHDDSVHPPGGAMVTAPTAATPKLMTFSTPRETSPARRRGDMGRTNERTGS